MCNAMIGWVRDSRGIVTHRTFKGDISNAVTQFVCRNALLRVRLQCKEKAGDMEQRDFAKARYLNRAKRKEKK